jgi:peptidoglycan hydrolase-like protein with peptidoglycan-binding domain
MLAAVVAVAALLCVPGTGFAKDDRGDGAVASAKVLRSGGTLVRGEGYGVPHGSRAVRALQIRLQRRGFEPGPIDGLFGPLTQAAVLRFQQRHRLLVDGVVGPQTRKPLLAQPAARRDRPDGGRPAAAEPSPPEPGRGEGAPKDAARSDGAPKDAARSDAAPKDAARSDAAPKDGARGESAPEEPPIALDVPSAPALDPGERAAPDSTSGISPWIAAALGALGAGLALGALRLRASRQRGGPKRGAHVAPRLGTSDRRLSLGMVCAALLAVFAVGAAVGALFAANAADDGSASASEPRAALPLAQSSAGGGAVVKGERRPQRSLGAGSTREPLGHP